MFQGHPSLGHARQNGTNNRGDEVYDRPSPDSPVSSLDYNSDLDIDRVGPFTLVILGHINFSGIEFPGSVPVKYFGIFVTQQEHLNIIETGDVDSVPDGCVRERLSSLNVCRSSDKFHWLYALPNRSEPLMYSMDNIPIVWASDLSHTTMRIVSTIWAEKMSRECLEYATLTLECNLFLRDPRQFDWEDVVARDMGILGGTEEDIVVRDWMVLSERVRDDPTKIFRMLPFRS